MENNELKEAGLDLQDLLTRLMQNTSLVKMFISKFVEDKTFENLKEAFNANNIEEAERASHSLKGMCGNLSLKPLFELFSEQVSLIRSGDIDAATAMMPQISQQYDNTVSHLKVWLSQQ